MGEHERGESRALAVVRRHLAAVDASGDPARLFAPEVAADVERLERELSERLTLDRSLALGWVALHRSRAAHGEAATAHRMRALWFLLPPFLVGEGAVPAEAMPAELLPELAGVAVTPAMRMLREAGEDGTVESAGRALWAWMRIVSCIGPQDAAGIGALANLGVAMRLLGERGAGAHYLEKAVVVSREAATRLAADDPRLPDALGIVASSWWSWYEDSGKAEHLDEAVRAAVDGARAGGPGIGAHPDRVRLASTVLYRRFRSAGAVSDLEESISWSRRLIETTDVARAGDVTGAARASDVADAARTADVVGAARASAATDAVRADHLSDAAGADHVTEGAPAKGAAEGAPVTEVTDAADAIDPDPPSEAYDPSFARDLGVLGERLSEYAELTGDTHALDEAAELARRTVTVAADDDLEARLAAAGIWHTVFGRTADRAALERSRALGVSSARALAPEHADRARHLSNNALTLILAHENSGVPADLDEALALGEEALACAPPGHRDRDAALNAVSGGLAQRYRRDSDLADLDRAIALGRELTRAPGARPATMGLCNLSTLLRTRFVRTGDAADIAQAVEAARAALDSARDRRLRARSQEQLALCLVRRFAAGGSPADLDAAVELGREALAGMPRDRPDWVTLLANHSLALLTRYEHTGALEDIDACLAAIRGASRRLDPGHPGLADLLNNEGYALLTRHYRTRSADELDEAVACGRRAVALTSAGAVRLPGTLSNLALALRTRFALGADPADLAEAIAVGRRAVEATAAGSPARAQHLNNLGYALMARSAPDAPADEAAGRDFGEEEAADGGAALDEAAQVFQEVLELMPPGAAARTYPLMNLGQILAAKSLAAGPVEAGSREEERDPAARRSRQGASDAFAEAFALTGAPPHRRITAARAAAQLLAGERSYEAAGLLAAAVDLLPALTPRMLARGDQQSLLGTCFELAADAAALALVSEGGPDVGPARAEPGPPEQAAARALRLLESGRGLMLGQALDTRGDITELRHQHPDLAADFLTVRRRLNTASGDAPGGWAPAEPWQPATEARRDLAAEFTAVLERIRARSGFGRFLLPPLLSELLAQAEHGPVVVIAVSGHGSHALLVRPDGVGALPLPALDRDAVRRRAAGFAAARRAATSTSPDRRERGVGFLNATLEWLWDAAGEPVLNELGLTAPPPPGQAPPRVWWSPGGLLGLLPLHAAGHHRHPGPGAGRTVMDRVVSSYTPTLRALRHARRPLPPDPSGRGLVVAMPLTPGASPLPYTAEEESSVRAHLPRARVLTAAGPVEGRAEEPAAAVREAVLGALADCSLAHFACHAVSDPADPSRSALLLEDAPLTVASLAELDLDGARLAYLSACSTATTGAPVLGDEFVNLATAFHLAGFRSVIATLWPVYDRSAADLARLFYAALDGPAGPDPDRAARALHHAVRQLRDLMPDRPDVWAAHLHSGA
ncbi:CHAT domain-containing protein [Streptomyces sp. NPDC059070]|uniref:CHAT domain-containing protein n=1 Tax=Streptomyces sp. NPDC059070 TaxID=3346713 RepID=UPI0036CA8B88